MPQIDKFTVRGFRSFKHQQTLKFANFKADGSACGITYIVGENNTGKTSILEALRIGDSNNGGSTNGDSIIKYGEATNYFSLCLYSHFSKANILRKIILRRKGSCLTKNIIEPISKDIFSFIPSRRYWNTNVMNGTNIDYDNARQNASNNMSLRQTTNNYQSMQIAEMLYSIESSDDQTLYSETIDLIKEIFPDFNSFGIVSGDSLQITYQTGNIEHRADLLGDGVVSVIAIAAFLVKKKGSVLVIDEPELSLHPIAQKRLAKLLYERSHEQQIIISTHSPYFIDWKYLKEGAVLNRIVKIKDKESIIFTIDRWSTYEGMLSGKDYQKPHLLDVVAKEIFFEDNILFVEGQDDMSLLASSNVLSENINIFGYGVGGKGNLELALQMANDIGIQKAAALIDGGEEEKDIFGKLVNKFKMYKIVQWGRHDIRDKEKTKLNQEDHTFTTSMLEGYYTTDGNLKEERGEFDEKIDNINKYFELE